MRGEQCDCVCVCVLLLLGRGQSHCVWRLVPCCDERDCLHLDSGGEGNEQEKLCIAFVADEDVGTLALLPWSNDAPGLAGL